MATNLPVDIAASFPDRSPGDATHQEHHDTVHGVVNEVSAELEGRLSEAGLNAAYAGLGPAATGTPATDRANLQAFIDAAATAGSPRRLPGGVYSIDATLTTPSNVDIDFGGATIKRVGAVFTMLTNADTTNGNSGIVLRNLVIDGDKDTDALVAGTVAHRFGGLVLTKVTDSLLSNVTVTGTVNAEDTAGVYFNQCSDVVARGLNGWGNDRSAIMLVNSSRCIIEGSLTRNNVGSGITSSGAHECQYLDIVTHDNGYSNLSINGLRSLAANVLSYGAGYSGVNVGHTTNPADDSQLANIVSYNNTYEGITITNSARVSVTNFECHGNARNNIRIYTSSTQARLMNGTSRDSAGGQGVYVESGKGHQLANVAVFGNAISGVNIAAGASEITLQGCKVYNNGKITSANSAGILINSTTMCKVIGCDAYDDQTTKTQESGIWIAAGSNHIVSLTYVPVNKTYGLRQTSNPTGIVAVNNITA